MKLTFLEKRIFFHQILMILSSIECSLDIFVECVNF